MGINVSTRTLAIAGAFAVSAGIIGGAAIFDEQAWELVSAVLNKLGPLWNDVISPMLNFVGQQIHDWFLVPAGKILNNFFGFLIGTFGDYWDVSANFQTVVGTIAGAGFGLRASHKLFPNKNNIGSVAGTYVLTGLTTYIGLGFSIPAAIIFGGFLGADFIGSKLKKQNQDFAQPNEAKPS